MGSQARSGKPTTQPGQPPEISERPEVNPLPGAIQGVFNQEGDQPLGRRVMDAIMALRSRMTPMDRMQRQSPMPELPPQAVQPPMPDLRPPMTAPADGSFARPPFIPRRGRPGF